MYIAFDNHTGAIVASGTDPMQVLRETIFHALETAGAVDVHDGADVRPWCRVVFVAQCATARCARVEVALRSPEYAERARAEVHAVIRKHNKDNRGAFATPAVKGVVS